MQIYNQGWRNQDNLRYGANHFIALIEAQQSNLTRRPSLTNMEHAQFKENQRLNNEFEEFKIKIREGLKSIVAKFAGSWCFTYPSPSES